MGVFDVFGKSLKKTRDAMFGAISGLAGAGQIDEAFYDDLEEHLILADVGVTTTEKIITSVKAKALRDHFNTGEQVIALVKETIKEMLEVEEPFNLSGTPCVLLMIGVNGVGKTTSAAKLAALYKSQGKKVLLAAGDTFRAAATEQLEIWANRLEIDIVKKPEGSDPSAVIFDAVSMATAQGYDIVICDTAGRLHTKKNLMEELNKISRVAKKAAETCSVETLLVLDAVTGQNAIRQATEFIDAADATGIVLTKLDGTAKGGSVISIKDSLGLPVRFVTVGESVDDLMAFDAEAFAEALFMEE
jgi:signal recognition particle-docking protein FtsY